MPSKFWAKNRTRSTTTAVGGGQPHRIPGLPEQGQEQYIQQQYNQHQQSLYQNQIPQGDPPAYQQQAGASPIQQQQQQQPGFNFFSPAGIESQQGARDERIPGLDDQGLIDTQEKIKSLRGRFGLNASSRHSLGSSSPGLSRRISLRRGAEVDSDSQQGSPSEKRHSFQWSSRGNSTNNLLAVTQEEQHGQLDPNQRVHIEGNSIQNPPPHLYQSSAGLIPVQSDPALQQQVSPLPDQYRQQLDPQAGPQTYYPPPQLPSPQQHPAPHQGRYQPQPLDSEDRPNSRDQFVTPSQSNPSITTQQGQIPPKAPGGATQGLARSSQDSARMPVQRGAEASVHPRLIRTETEKSTSSQTIPPRDSSKHPPQQAGHLSSSQASNSGMAPFGANIVPPSSQGQPYKGGHVSNLSESQGRTSPQPSQHGDQPQAGEDELTQLVKDHKELREKYNKVKKYYFEKEDQVKQLQNSLAHQRLSQSKTSLDDNEYTTRFTRLDGLIAQLAFSIRKSWRSIPPWLQSFVNKDAVATGKQEMTAVGRAAISSFLVDELFDKYFHPDLDLTFSERLKSIQNNMINFAPPCTNAEEEEALRLKVINWRLSTVEGMQEMFRSPDAPENREELVRQLSDRLVATLAQHMVDPVPSDLEGGVHMIIELSVSIATNLPLESREVSIWYPTPGNPIQTDVMKVEGGIPALTTSVAASEENDQASVQSTEDDSKDNSPAVEPQIPDKKRGMFSGLMAGSKKGPPPRQTAGDGSQSSLSQPTGSTAGKEDQPPRVRFAAFMMVQVKGKSVLFKAPVFST
ncbi:MAG: hypothetical protein M1820_005340 [Bogoriella megaspora]|nr:MAG: hypothetical protein M1820_005340 [Bogoriella megaspora]